MPKKPNGVNIFPVAIFVQKFLVGISKPTIRSLTFSKSHERNQESAGQPGGRRVARRRWMSCREDAECSGGSRVAWGAAERVLLNSWDDNRWSGAPCPGEHPIGQEGAGSSEGRRTPSGQKGAKQLRFRLPVRSGRRLHGQGAMRRVWNGGGYGGRCCVKISVYGHHSITK